MIRVVASSEKYLENILDWLKKEQNRTGEGFYCNKDIIVDSHQEGEVHVALDNDIVVGFVVDHLYSYSKGSSIDILEVHPHNRHRGIGKALALNSISRLFELGAELVNVECTPHSSEAFWRKLGFSPSHDIQSSTSGNPRLILKKQPI